jgi:hypothetical protein
VTPLPRIHTLLLLLLATFPAFADPPPINDLASGPDLAAQIRNAVPEDTNAIHGTLTTDSSGSSHAVPVVCRVLLLPSSWETIYDVPAAAASAAEQLIVIHASNAPNQYLYSRASSPSAPLPAPSPISSRQAADTPLAGSDFSAADLGLDFLHWPQQRRLKGEMRLGQPCYVLDSSDPGAPSIARVKSYIDKETCGLLIAEAYDASNHLVKEFSLHGSSFKKVNGHWRLEKMEIRDRKKMSRTTLKFDILNE